MNNICEKIKLFLEKYDLVKPDLTYLVAFSGGYDSMCLLDCLKKVTHNRIVAIHLNHKWRGEESDLEEENCKNFCQNINVEFFSKFLGDDIPQTETAARNARYDFFKYCAKKFNSRIVFTAHNFNDNAETLLYRICMGTGVQGLQGISENRDIFYRPLLSVSRNEIEKYCFENELKPNNDSSNSNIKYKRNFIRAEIFPQLAQVNPNIFDNLNSLAEIAKEETSIIDEYLSPITKKITCENKIKTAEYLKLSEAVQKRLIYKIFIQKNLDYDRKKILKIWNFILKNSHSKSGKKTSLTDDLLFFVSEKYIEIFSKKTQNFAPILIEKEGKYKFENFVFEIEKCTKSVEKFPKDTDFAAYVVLENFPLELRTRQEGDVIAPFGLGGKQKLKKYLNEKKIPNHEKDSLLLLACGKEILWVAGVGISDKIKVIENPTHKLKLYLK